jgi:hypothetical protein
MALPFVGSISCGQVGGLAVEMSWIAAEIASHLSVFVDVFEPPFGAQIVLAIPRRAHYSWY